MNFDDMPKEKNEETFYNANNNENNHIMAEENRNDSNAIKEPDNIPNKEHNEGAQKLIEFSIINSLIIIICNYLVTRNIKYALFIIPALVLLITIVTSNKYKEKNDYPTSVLLGGVFSGIVMFLVSMISKDVELYTHLAIVCAVCGIIGYMISSITNFLLSAKNKTGIQVLGILLFYTIIIALPIYLYKTKPNLINQYVFYNRKDIIAATENEYVTETLKSRYGIKFVCGEDISKVAGYENDQEIIKEKSTIDQDNKLSTTRTCIDENSNKFMVTSIEYNKAKVQYVVQDQYLEDTKLSEEKENISKSIISSINATQVKVYIYPQKYCHFIGDCISTNEYFEVYEEENDFNKMFEASKSIDLRKYVHLDAKELLNEYSFKYQIFIYGNYSNRSETELMEIIETTLEVLNKGGYKNTFGYEIIVLDVTNKDLQSKILSVYGTTNDKKDFNNPVIEKKKENQ